MGEKHPSARLWQVLPAIFLLSFSVLTFEVALTRIFSVMLSYHFVFAIVSASLLGLGIGGMLWSRCRRLLAASTAPLASALFALLIAASVLAIIGLPVHQAGSAAGGFWLYLLLAALPFSAAGLAVAGLFQQFAERGSLLYGADLLGATLAALMVVPLLDAFGGVHTVFAAAMAAGAGAALLGMAHRQKVRALALGSFLLPAGAFIVFTLFGVQLPVPVANDPNKDMYRMLNNPAFQATIVESRWSSFGRTDLVASRLLPNEMTLYIDGAAGSPMYNLNALWEDPAEVEHLTLRFGGFFPFLFLEDGEKESALIIGPGGGRDVVVALLGGVGSITAVEVNPDVVQIVKDYEDYNGGIYSRHPRVNVVVAEGRNFLRASDQRYDLIMLTIPVTKSSRSVEGYALTENFLFTVEAFEDYFRALTPGGRLIIVAHDDAEIYRLITLAAAALERRGVPQREALTHLYTLASGMMPTLVIRNQPLTQAEAAAVHAGIHELGFDRGNYFVPFVRQVTIRPEERLDLEREWRMFDQILVDVAAGRLDLARLARAASVDIGPVTDDRPFFYKFERGLPSPFGVFAFLIVAALAVLVASVARRGRRGGGDAAAKPFLLVFSTLGVAFMLVEIALFQKLMLHIGQPQRALTVLLFSLLLGGGLGSLASSLLRRRPERAMAVAGAAAALLVPILSLTFPPVFRLGLDARLTAALLLSPLGFLLGMPFPLAIRLMKEKGLGERVHRMWGVNGIASVLGSALAMIVGLTVGFSFALYLGALLYAGVVLLALVLVRLRSAEPVALNPR